VERILPQGIDILAELGPASGIEAEVVTRALALFAD
jgi:hypothetical protein